MSISAAQDGSNSLGGSACDIAGRALIVTAFVAVVLLGLVNVLISNSPYSRRSEKGWHEPTSRPPG